MKPLPECCVSTGDPQGIGPEVSVKAARAAAAEGIARIVLVGRDDVLAKAGADRGWPRIEPGEKATAPVSVLRVAGGGAFAAPPPSAEGGSAALEALDGALARVRAASHRALVTAPVSKKAVTLSGRPFDGHTGYIARVCGAPLPVMLFETPTFRVALATVHVPLRAVAGFHTPASLLELCRVVAGDLERRFGIARPRLALLGINPHAGESGLLGHEDADVVAATVALGAAEGLSLSGPHPADTWFRPGFEGAADCVVAMYHDQGLLPVKCLAFGSAVNVTLGLPIVRTSVDHGTAFDIAGKGSADAGSMAEALRLAARLAARSAGA